MKRTGSSRPGLEEHHDRDLERQLREYASHVTDLSPAVDIDALLTEQAEPLPPLALRSRPRRAAALVAAAMIVVVVGGLALGYRFLVTDLEPVVTQPSSWDLVPPISNQPEGLWVKSLTWDGDELMLLGSALRDGDQALVLGTWTGP